MKILVVGAGISGLTFAISHKRSHPSAEIFVIEHLPVALKKVLATGNGKCNIANTSKLDNIYNSNYVSNIMYDYDFKVINSFLESINIITKNVNELVYPITESAVTVREAYLKAVMKYKIQILYEEEIDDYILHDKYFEVFLKSKTMRFDKIVFSTGGASQPNLGSDGKIFNLLKEHGYEITNLTPALCPIRVNENVKSLDGIRVKAKVTLKIGNKNIFSESGEVLFKKDGLSGIVIFNLSRIIARNLDEKYTISIDPLENISFEDLGIFLSFSNPETLCDTYLHPLLSAYIKKMNLKGNELINAIKNMKFTFKELYGFEFSQVTHGGVAIKNIDDKLGSIKEKGVYFIGEILDVDAPCGGFNLMWAIASGLYVGDYL